MKPPAMAPIGPRRIPPIMTPVMTPLATLCLCCSLFAVMSGKWFWFSVGGLLLALKLVTWVPLEDGAVNGILISSHVVSTKTACATGSASSIGKYSSSKRTSASAKLCLLSIVMSSRVSRWWLILFLWSAQREKILWVPPEDSGNIFEFIILSMRLSQVIHLFSHWKPNITSAYAAISVSIYCTM